MVKSVTLVSVGITTVVLVILAGVIYAYQGFMTARTGSTPQVSPPAAVSYPLIASAPTDTSPTDTPSVSPQEAASIAAKFSNRTDLYAVEVSDFTGTQSYKVTFSSGDVVYVAMNGQVLGIVQATATVPPVVVASNPLPRHVGGGHGGNSGGGGGGEGGGEGESQGGGD